MWLVQLPDLGSLVTLTHCGCHPCTIQTSQLAERCVQPSVAQCLWFVVPGTEIPGTQGISVLVSHIQVVLEPFNAALQVPPSEKSHARAE